MTGLEVGLSVVAGAATVVSTYVGLLVKPLEKDLSAEVKQREADRGSLEERIQGLHDDSKEEREKIERRITAIEQSYISRNELERTINSVGDRMDRGLARLEESMKSLNSKMEHMAERVTRVEAS